MLNRRERSFEQTTDALVEHLVNFLQMTRRQRIELRNRTERLGEVFDWSNLARHYDEAHNMALERVGASAWVRWKCVWCSRESARQLKLLRQWPIRDLRTSWRRRRR